MEFSESLRKLRRMEEEAAQDEQRARQSQKALGRLTARERAERLFDPQSFVELDAFAREGNALCGWGLVNDRPVYLLAQDAAHDGGAMSAVQARKMLRALDMAERAGAPVVLMPDSAGAKVSEGAAMLAAYSRVFTRLAQLKGVVPIVSLLAGSTVGIASYFATLSDLAVAVDHAAQVMPFPPSIQNAVHGTSLDAQALGGAEALAKKGIVAMTAGSEDAGIILLRQVLELLPGSAMPYVADIDLNRLVPAPPDSMLDLLTHLFDRGTSMSLFEEWREGCHTWIGRIGGYSVGVVATEPAKDGGRLDAFACDNISRMAKICDSFGLPLISVLDSEGLAVPTHEGQAWLMTASERMLRAYARAEVSKLALITGNAVGSAYVCFAGAASADVTLAWPGAYVAPLTKEAAAQAFAMERIGDEGRSAMEKEQADAADAFEAARLGLVDQVIDPAESRKHLIAALELLAANACSPTGGAE